MYRVNKTHLKNWGSGCIRLVTYSHTQVYMVSGRMLQDKWNFKGFNCISMKDKDINSIFFLFLTRWTILSSETGTTHLSKLINNNPSVSCASAKARHGNHITSTMYYVSWYRSYALLCLVSLFSLDFSVLVKAII